MSDFFNTPVGTPTRPTKAIVGTVIGFVALVATGLVDLFPDPTVQLVLKVILVVTGAASVYVGVYQTTNKPVSS